MLNITRDTFDSISINEFNYLSKNNSNYKANKTQRLIKSKSNIINFDGLRIEEEKNFLSIRELYRRMIKAKEKEDQKKNNLFKRKKLKNCLKKKSQKFKNKNKIYNSNLMSLEQYIYEKMKKKREIYNTIKISKNNYIGKKSINDKSVNLYYRYIL